MITPNKAGYITLSGAGKTVECDTITCRHCMRIVVTSATQPEFEGDLGYGFCLACSHDICGPCETRARVYGCEDFRRRLEKAENRCRFLQTIE